jgi:hypothetical protein
MNCLFLGVSCKPASECQIVYGTDPQHFVTFGFVTPEDNQCLVTQQLVLCVDQPAVPLTTVTSTTTSAPTSATVTAIAVTPTVEISNPVPPYFYNNVQIIGPKPIYITYNSVVGPSVSNNYGRKTKKPAKARPDQAFFEDVYKHLKDD